MNPLERVVALWKEAFLRQLHPLFWWRLAVTSSARVALLGVQTSEASVGAGLPLGFFVAALVLSSAEAPLEISLARFHIAAYRSIRAAFRKHDADGNGFVSLEELHAVAADLHSAHALDVPASERLARRLGADAARFSLDDVLAMRKNHDSHHGMLVAAALAFSSGWIAYVGSLMMMRDAQGAMLGVALAQGVISVFDVWSLLVRFVAQYVSAFRAPSVCFCSLTTCITLCSLVPLLVLFYVAFVVVCVVSFAVPASSETLPAGVPIDYAPGFYSGVVLTAVIIGVVVNVVITVHCVLCCWARRHRVRRALGKPAPSPGSLTILTGASAAAAKLLGAQPAGPSDSASSKASKRDGGLVATNPGFRSS